jgi:hypothetical protein
MTAAERRLIVRWLQDLADAVEWTVSVCEVGLVVTEEKGALMKKIKSYHPVSMEIDGEPVVIHVKRMSSPEVDEFEAGMQKFGFALDGSTPTLDVRRANGHELATWLVEVVSKYITVPPGQIVVEDDDGQEHELRTGAELIATFGGRVDLIPALFLHIWSENRLPERIKTRFREAALKNIANAMPDFDVVLPMLDAAIVAAPVAAAEPPVAAEPQPSSAPPDLFAQ